METRIFFTVAWIKKKLPVFGLVLFEIECSSLRFVTKFWKKEKWFTNLEGDKKPKIIETNFSEVTVLFQIGLEVIFALVAVVEV